MITPGVALLDAGLLALLFVNTSILVLGLEAIRHCALNAGDKVKTKEEWKTFVINNYPTYEYIVNELYELDQRAVAAEQKIIELEKCIWQYDTYINPSRIALLEKDCVHYRNILKQIANISKEEVLENPFELQNIALLALQPEDPKNV